ALLAYFTDDNTEYGRTCSTPQLFSRFERALSKTLFRIKRLYLLDTFNCIHYYLSDLIFHQKVDKSSARYQTAFTIFSQFNNGSMS
ncbi:hypothetical protein L9F63_004806, partial [Diploptera punctata]